MDNRANYACDLHGHTNRSDGSDSPLEFIHHAVERGVKIAAITDHDVVPPGNVTVAGKEQDIVEYAAGCGLKLIKGTEISCETDIEDTHLVCFQCDWEAPFFEELDRFTSRSKVNSYKRLLDRLRDKGMSMSWDEVRSQQGRILDEEKVQKKMIFNMMAKKGYTSDWSAAKLLVKNDPDLSIRREKPDAVRVIKEIKQQGGIVIMAHPYLVSEEVDYRGQTISRADFIDELIRAGLDGIEARYTYDKTSYSGSLSKEEIYREVTAAYKDRLPVISGGSDYHADGKNGTVNPRDIGECGLTEEEFMNNPLLRQLINYNCNDVKG